MILKEAREAILQKKQNYHSEEYVLQPTPELPARQYMGSSNVCCCFPNGCSSLAIGFHVIFVLYSTLVLVIVNHSTATGQNQHHNLVARNTTLYFNIVNTCCSHFYDLSTGQFPGHIFYLHFFQFQMRPLQILRSSVIDIPEPSKLKCIFTIYIFQNIMQDTRIKE